MKRVVITGMGSLTAIGTNVNETFVSLCNGKSGIRNVEYKHEDIANLGARIGAPVTQDFDLDFWLAKTPSNFRTKGLAYSLAAATEALVDAGWLPSADDDHEATAVIGGICFNILSNVINEIDGELEDEATWQFMPHSDTNFIASSFNFQGPAITVNEACATSLLGVIEGYELIQNMDSVRTVLVGGSEDSQYPYIISMLNKIQALNADCNENAEETPGPFDSKRTGFVLGESSAFVLIEELNHAKQRGAPIYAEILGSGITTDAFHLTRPRDFGAGLQACMTKAIDSAHKTPHDIEHVNCHGTATPAGDMCELQAIRKVFNHYPSVTGNKGNIGHTIACAGLNSLIFTVKAMQKGQIPPIYGCKDPLLVEGEEREYPNLVRELRSTSVNTALVNALGFGGVNTSLVVSKFN